MAYPEHDLIFGSFSFDVYKSYVYLYKIITGELYLSYALDYVYYEIDNLGCHGLLIKKSDRDRYIDDIIWYTRKLCKDVRDSALIASRNNPYYTKYSLN